MDVRQAVGQLRAKFGEATNFDAAFNAAVSEALQRSALRNVGGLAMMGLGLGAGVRGITGLSQLIHRNLDRDLRPRPKSIIVDVPIAKGQDEKLAGVLTNAGSSMADFAVGRDATSLSGVPWYMPAAVAAGGGGLYGGWKFMDWLLDKRREGDISSELEEARQEYEKALRGEPAAARVAGTRQAGPKLAAISEDLDKLYENFEKSAATIGDLSGKAVGAWGGLWALPSALAAGVLGYRFGKKRRQRELLDKAQRQRIRQLAAAQPISIYANPVSVRSTKNVPDDILTGEGMNLDQEDPQRAAVNV